VQIGSIKALKLAGPASSSIDFNIRIFQKTLTLAKQRSKLEYPKIFRQKL
jgi:hypothetical protein